MSDDAKTAIADLIMQRPISEIDTTSDDVSEKLITLECGHIFTIETLDGHCSMTEYYDVDPMTGCYLGMKAPPVKYQNPPACPTCRGPITSPRYGRVTKRANLEQNVASNMSKWLERHRPSLEAIAAGLEASETAAKAIVKGVDFALGDDFARICDKRNNLFGKPEEPLPVKMLRELKTFHGFSRKEAEQWIKIAKEINRVYEAIASVTSARSAHVKAYEAAMTTLFELEMEAIAWDPSKANEKTQQEAAFAAASAKIGQPPYKADRKYHIEAFLLSIELRLMLAQIASARISELPLTSEDHDHPRHRQIWVTFVGFLYDSCIKDCAKAASLARSCSALRQEARVTVVNLRCTFEKVRFDALEEYRKIHRPLGSGDSRSHTRESLIELVSQQKVEAEEVLSQARARYFQNRPIDTQERVAEEDLWFRENCTSRAKKTFAAYEDLQERISRAEIFYQPMSSEEKKEIVSSFVAHFGYSGRFLNCGNGHTFVITECGGAMQASTCPECGLPIGGTNYNLHASNTPATDYHL